MKFKKPKTLVVVYPYMDEEPSSNFRKLRDNDIIRKGDFYSYTYVEEDSFIKTNYLYMAGAVDVSHSVKSRMEGLPDRLKRIFYRRVNGS